MDRKPNLPPIWEMDPKANNKIDLDAIEALFQAAFEHAFRLRATRRRIRPYLLRYLRFQVIPPWMRTYVKEVLHGESVANVGDAPLDPVIDLRPLFWRSALAIYLFLEARKPSDRGPHMKA